MMISARLTLWLLGTLLMYAVLLAQSRSKPPAPVEAQRVERQIILGCTPIKKAGNRWLTCKGEL